MSASTEIILEQIKDAETRLLNASGDEAFFIKEELSDLRKRLASANQALTEGKQVLKG